jgi:hypothetical protein
VTRRTYQEDFARDTRKAGLPPEFIPHSLRHCYASNALAGGIPITEVSRWLGHKSIEVTTRSTGTSSPPPGTAPAPSSTTPIGPAATSHHPRNNRAESVLTANP